MRGNGGVLSVCAFLREGWRSCWRYFIVIDDLWDQDAWEIIKCALVDNNFGSRIIVTTRNIDVANFASSKGGEVYELDTLSEKDSRRLLYKRVFNEEDGIYSELDGVTNKILNKCGGIPLAIITIASMLASRPNMTEDEWYGVYYSMGSGLEKYKTLDNMRNILHLSYSDLPSYLKPCLLYLSMFPEDYDIPRRGLVRLWVAEGFVDENQGFVAENQESNSYDIGERYFNELVNRSMIMPVDMDEYGVAGACRVHGMILDLIISLSAQENFCNILQGLPLKSTLCKIRRISLQSEQMILPQTDNRSHVRSLIVFGYKVQGMPPLPWFSFLRVLFLEGVASKVIQPKDLGSLHHLRYLELRGDFKPELLEGIGNLKLLKTLDLQNASVCELPACIVQLRQLELLLLNNGMELPDGIGNLTSLQQVSTLNVDRSSPDTLAELGKLTELRVLDIQGFEYDEGDMMETFLQSLSNLDKLHTLNLEAHNFEFDESNMETFLQSLSNLGKLHTLKLDVFSFEYSKPDQWRVPSHLQVFNGNGLIFSKLPRSFSSLCELSCLSISVNVLRQVDIQLLGALPRLRFLKLKVNEDGTTEEQLVIGSDKPFGSLIEFKFELWHWATRCWLMFAQGAMPRLQRLKLCVEARKRMGGGFDVGLENLTSLKHVTVEVECYGARTREVEDAETQIRDAVDGHPNHPTLKLSRTCQTDMVED